MKNETKTICVTEAEKLVPKVRENCRRASAPEPPGGITEWFVLVLAVDLYQAVLAGRVIPIPADVYYRTAGILNAAAEEQQAEGVEDHRVAPCGASGRIRRNLSKIVEAVTLAGKSGFSGSCAASALAKRAVIEHPDDHHVRDYSHCDQDDVDDIGYFSDGLFHWSPDQGRLHGDLMVTLIQALSDKEQPVR